MQKKTVRYILSPDVRFLMDDQGQTFPIGYGSSTSHRFVDILEKDDAFIFAEHSIKIRVYCEDGTVHVGWLSKSLACEIRLLNKEELFDGRFNADRVGEIDND